MEAVLDTEVMRVGNTRATKEGTGGGLQDHPRTFSGPRARLVGVRALL